MSDKNNDITAVKMSDKKRGRPTKGNEKKVSVRLPNATIEILERYGKQHGINTSDAVRLFLERYGTALAMSEEISGFRNGVSGLTDIQEAILEEYRRSGTTESLLDEIFASTHFMTSTVWCNVAYNGNLYKSNTEKQKIANELRNSADTISKLFNSLADGVEKGKWDKNT